MFCLIKEKDHLLEKKDLLLSTKLQPLLFLFKNYGFCPEKDKLFGSYIRLISEPFQFHIVCPFPLLKLG